jgi:hypothetical protein
MVVIGLILSNDGVEGGILFKGISLPLVNYISAF